MGETAEHQKPECLGEAVGLLSPIAGREPFGLAMIEAMACGTPVLAMGNGSVPEVVDEGVTGFIVADEAGAAAAARRLHLLDRERIRKVFEKRFTARRMAEDYVALYRCLVPGREAVRVLACGGSAMFDRIEGGSACAAGCRPEGVAAGA